MPVIKLTLTGSPFSDTKRKQLVERLKSEVEGATTIDGPVVFEIPLDDSDKMDVLVVWDAWQDTRNDIRSGIILEAYTAKQNIIAQALGVTYKEALEQQVLPYRIVPMARGGEVGEGLIRDAMLRHGAIPLPNGKVDLRLPTMKLAEAVHRQLYDELPKGYWSIVQTVAEIP